MEDLVAERQKGEERCKDAAQSSSQKRPKRDDDEPGPTEQPLKEAEQLQFCAWERELGRELKNPVPDILNMELILADTNNNLG